MCAYSINEAASRTCSTADSVLPPSCVCRACHGVLLEAGSAAGTGDWSYRTTAQQEAYWCGMIQFSYVISFRRGHCPKGKRGSTEGGVFQVRFLLG